MSILVATDREVVVIDVERDVPAPAHGIGDRLTPVDVCAVGATPPCSVGNGNALTNVTALAASYYHTCALVTGGSVRCWGENASGQLGDGTTVDRRTPVVVRGPNNIVGLAAGDTITWPLPDGREARLRILAVEAPAPETAA